MSFKSVAALQELVAREIPAFFIRSVFFYSFEICCIRLWHATSMRNENHLQCGNAFHASAHKNDQIRI